LAKGIFFFTPLDLNALLKFIVKDIFFGNPFLFQQVFTGFHHNDGTTDINFQGCVLRDVLVNEIGYAPFPPAIDLLPWVLIGSA
jgi:hypothetical protein